MQAEGRKTEGSKKSEVLELKYTLIDSIMECIRVVEEILLKESILALDCEGVLLSKEGRLTLMQISLIDERVFIFDILKGGSLMFLGLDETRRGLKAVLENKKILKLIHDCRNDWDSLLHQYSVRIYNFIDTQEAYFLFKLFYYQEITLPISLSKFIENITNAKLEYKQKFKNVMNEDPYMWGNRPLTSEQLAYASEDVVYLIKAWEGLKDKFNDNLKEIVFFLTILKVVDISMFTQFREYLVANIIYFGMLENVFSSPNIYAYIFAVDYVYNFLQIKMMTEREGGNKNDGNGFDFPMKESNLLPDEAYYRFVKDENGKNGAETASSIIKFGINFKKKQRILSLKQFKEEEMALIEKMVKTSKIKNDADSNLTGKNKFNMNYSNSNGNGKSYYKKYISQSNQNCTLATSNKYNSNYHLQNNFNSYNHYKSHSSKNFNCNQHNKHSQFNSKNFNKNLKKAFYQNKNNLQEKSPVNSEDNANATTPITSSTSNDKNYKWNNNLYKTQFKNYFKHNYQQGTTHTQYYSNTLHDKYKNKNKKKRDSKNLSDISKNEKYDQKKNDPHEFNQSEEFENEYNYEQDYNSDNSQTVKHKEITRKVSI